MVSNPQLFFYVYCSNHTLLKAAEVYFYSNFSVLVGFSEFPSTSKRNEMLCNSKETEPSRAEPRWKKVYLKPRELAFRFDLKIHNTKYIQIECVRRLPNDE